MRFDISRENKKKQTLLPKDKVKAYLEVVAMTLKIEYGNVQWKVVEDTENDAVCLIAFIQEEIVLMSGHVFKIGSIEEILVKVSLRNGKLYLNKFGDVYLNINRAPKLATNFKRFENLVANWVDNLSST